MEISTICKFFLLRLKIQPISLSGQSRNPSVIEILQHVNWNTLNNSRNIDALRSKGRIDI